MSTAVLTEAKCDLRFEKCKGGFRIECCRIDDCGEFQSLCQALCDDGCTCCCMLNGVQLCNFRLGCDDCTCERTNGGCSITFTSGDAKRCKMLQACCDCLECCCENGCDCSIAFGDTCICVGNCAT